MAASFYTNSGDAAGYSDSPHVVQAALSGYSDEAYTNAKKLSGTEIVGSNSDIDTNTETFIGQIRWRKPITPVINIASLVDDAPGTTTSYGTEFLKYIKSVRTHGAKKINMQQIVTQEDGLAKIGRDFGETRAQDEHNAILAVLRGVALTEVLYGAGSGSGVTGEGGQTFTNDPTSTTHGFYVDLGSSKTLISTAAAGNIGAQRATDFLQAFGMAYKDYEPDYAYLITSPEVFASIRSANLVDEDRIVDGNLSFSTIFQGKFRLLQTRASQGFSAAELAKITTGAGPNITGTKTSFIVLPGAIAMSSLPVPDSVEIERDAKAFSGGGTTSIWYRWGYVLAPAGYSWIGSETAFPSDAEYSYAIENDVPMALTSVADNLADTTGTWERKFESVLSLGILPIFHA